MMATSNSHQEFDDDGLDTSTESSERSEFSLASPDGGHACTLNGQAHVANRLGASLGCGTFESRHQSVDTMMQSRIGKIYQRLEVTDANLRRIEDLLNHQHQQQKQQHQQQKQQPQLAQESGESQQVRSGRRRSRSDERRASISSQSSGSISIQYRGDKNDDRETRVKSGESQNQNSPTLEQLQRLTQSMQDLHNYQQRFQDDLRTEVLNRSSNASSDIIRELSNWLRQNVEDSFRPKEILDKLTALQADLKSKENVKHVEDARSVHALENLRQEIEDLRRNMASLSASNSNKNDHVQKLSQLESQQLKVEANLEVLAKHFDVWSQHSLGVARCSRCDSHQQNMQHQLDEAVRTSLEASRMVNQAAHVLRRPVDSSSDALADDSSGVKEKAKKIIKKLKLKCDELTKEKDRYRRRCQLLEERCDLWVSEKESMCTQLEDLRVKLKNAVKEQQDIKTNIFEEQRQGSMKEIMIQRLKGAYDEIEKCAHQSQQEFQKKSIDSVDHLKDKLEASENHRREVVEQLSKQLEKEQKTRLNLDKEISELKLSSIREMSDVATRKERELEPIIDLLKKQVSTLQIQINDVYQENKTLSNERSQLNGELLRVQTENQLTTKKYEKLLKSFYTKNEELHSKVHRIDELDGNLTDFRKITHKMETEYKTMLCNINMDVDRTMQLWNMSLDDSLQAPASVSGIQCHPKVILVDIQSKLKWLQDDICLTSRSKVAPRDKVTNNLGSPPSLPDNSTLQTGRALVRSSSPKMPDSARGGGRMNIPIASTAGVHPANDPDHPSWDVSGIAKDTNFINDSFMLRPRSNDKQLNSTEAIFNLPQNRMSQRLKETRGTSLSSLSDEPTDCSSGS